MVNKKDAMKDVQPIRSLEGIDDVFGSSEKNKYFLYRILYMLQLVN